jgi:hypothetical protein
MLLPPNHPNKSFTSKEKIKLIKKKVNNKGLPDKVVKLAQKLQKSIDCLSSSEDASSLSEDGDNDDDVETNNDAPIEENVIKIKKAHKNYTKNLQQFEDLNKLDAYMRTVCLKFKKTHNNQVNCSSCNNNHDKT